MAYDYSTLNSRTKEIAELAEYLVLRCDDCSSYHVIRCWELGLSLEEVFEVCEVELVVGESIVVPHSRRAGARLDDIEDNEEETNAKWRSET